eukprot:scaffold268395_cov33-Tisochrysis_lutea.AAC.2
MARPRPAEITYSDAGGGRRTSTQELTLARSGRSHLNIAWRCAATSLLVRGLAHPPHGKLASTHRGGNLVVHTREGLMPHAPEVDRQKGRRHEHSYP